ncbi:MAG TPA: glycerol kinase GlpK [Candidatus Xenobia bacterium]|jgi:glycerol kinase
MTADAILALDLGTTGNRALVIDRQQHVLASAYREFPQIFPQPGWVEHDPEAIWQTTRDCLREVLAAVPVERIAGIGITNQRETVVLWDRASGQALHHAIVWQCRRTTDTCQALKEAGLEPIFRDKTGLVLDPYFSGTKIKWLLDHVPGARERAERGELAIGTIDSWVVHKLTGGQAHITDPSNASRTLLYNLQTRNWDPALCALLGIPPSLLPTLVPSSGSLATATADLLPSPLPILSLVGDQQAALFGQGCFDSSSLKNTYGTGLFLMLNTGPQPRASRNLLSTVAWDLAGTPSYAVEGSVFIGGAAIQWLRDQLGIIQHADESEGLARSVPDSGGVCFVPALAGLGAPYWDANARGLLIGLTRGTERAHVVRAALEAIAWQTRDVVDAMREDLGVEIHRLQVDGGAARNDFLMQFQADALGLPVERPVQLESTAMGAAGLAGLAAKVWADADDFASHRRVDRTFMPMLDPTERERRYRLWRLAVERCRGWAGLS